MIENWILLGIIIFSIVILLVVTCKRHKGVLTKITLRLVGGLIGIICTNWIMALIGINLYVGINLWTAVTVGTLGLPGYLLLYGILYAQNL